MRFRHAARFALPNFVGVLVASTGYELLEAFVRGDVPDGMTPAGAFAGNMAVWAFVAFVIGVVTFLLRLSDVVTRVPTWAFASVGAAWVGLSSVLVVHAIERGHDALAAATGIVASLFWIAVHRRIPGWAGSFFDATAGDARVPEQDLR